MKKLLLAVLAAVAGAAAVRRARAAQAEASLWAEATREPDLR